ncbi:unnamed protein product [Plutella xylostella]|uniref:(diamondback moth) hypothetical protein n=1 Tax=Plutella xylostella TaxID=51655 RepID=A0A8S4DA32_PLUXY|nr:unnamed protein product [Plutella xylostella]
MFSFTEAGTELLPRTHYGTFYDAEAYLAYSASLPGQPAGPDVIRREIKENGNEYAERHIHAWGGERGGALGALALRRGAQLAAHIGAPAVVHRETATKESPRLLSYFRDGIRILRSGSNSLTSSVRLYRVRGRRPVLIQLEPVSWAQLAADGVFVLDAPALLVLWLGRTANLVEKIFGAKLGPVSWAQLAADGVFVLDAPALLVLWLGRTDNLVEKIFGAMIAYRMARGADKGMTARRIAIAHDGYENTLPPADRALLDALLELRARAVRPATPIGTYTCARRYENTLPPADRALLDALLELRARAVRPATPIGTYTCARPYENTLPPADRALLDALLELRARAVRPATPIAEPPRPARIYKATQSPRPSHLTAPSQRPAARLEEVKRAPLYRSDLADDGVYIVDAGSRGVWAWVGAGAGAAAARGALAAARGLARARRHQGPVSVTPAGREPLEFAALFMGWRWSDQRREGRLRAARCATTRLDAVSLATNSWLAAEVSSLIL